MDRVSGALHDAQSASRAPRSVETQWPSNTTSAHPVRKIPSSRHSTRCVPPGAITWTSRAAPPCAIAAIADAHAPVPDACVGPTPRSQIRIRMRSTASTTANSTLVPSENRLVRRQRGAKAMEASQVGELLHQRDTLRIADRQRRHRQLLARGFDLFFDDPFRLPHRRPERVAAALPADQRQRFPARLGLDLHFGDRRRERLLTPKHHQRGETAQPVARQLRRAAVGVDEAHLRGAVRRDRVIDDTVSAEPGVAVAETAGQLVQLQAFHLLGGHEQEVVAVGVRFRNGQHRGYGTLNALKTQVKPPVKPISGSRGVRPSSRPASRRTPLIV